jgi:hypothetical protein
MGKQTLRISSRKKSEDEIDNKRFSSPELPENLHS